MTLTEENKKWIDNAKYYDLLKRNRFHGSDDEIFQGESGAYYMRIMMLKRTSLSAPAVIAISKAVGWGDDILC